MNGRIRKLFLPDYMGVYTLRSKDQGEESISGRVLDLEYARAERNRGELVQDLISQGLNP